MKPNIENIFKTVYERESDAIFRFCLVRVSDREQALDITQETFLRLWQTLSADTKIENQRAFLFTIARNLVIDWYRKKKSISLENMMAQREETEYDLMDEKSLDNLELEPEGRFLVEKINELSIASRDPVYLRFVEGLSPKEIGDVLGISANAASVRVNRGLSELRKKTGYNNENK